MNNIIAFISFGIICAATILVSNCGEARGNYYRAGSTEAPTQPRPLDELGMTEPDTNPSLRGVIVNGQRISDEILRPMEQYFGVHVPDGRYWYDKVSGAWGMEGGPAAGLTIAGMNLGGELRADASRGNTGVFINGRELHRQDVASLNVLFAPYSCQPGRFWVDSYGNFGRENGPLMGNLVQIYQAKFGSRQAGQKRVYDSGIGSVMSDGSGFIGYISGSSSATSW